MPLNTQIIRDGEPLKMPNGWGGFHVAAMVIAASFDSGRGPYKDMESFKEEVEGLLEKQGAIGINQSDVWQLMDYGTLSMTPLNEGEWTMTREMRFQDNTDGEILELKAGDVLRAYRSSR